MAIGAAIAAAAILVLAVVWRVSDADERTMAMVQTVSSAVTAEVTLIGERSGTRIEVACVYGDDPAGATRPFGLFVTDTEGSEALLASWTADPGSHSWPDATTGLAERDIERIDIRALDTGEVLLEVEP